jgi:hypothetical protein
VTRNMANEFSFNLSAHQPRTIFIELNTTE